MNNVRQFISESKTSNTDSRTKNSRSRNSRPARKRYESNRRTMVKSANGSKNIKLTINEDFDMLSNMEDFAKGIVDADGTLHDMATKDFLRQELAQNFVNASDEDINKVIKKFDLKENRNHKAYAKRLELEGFENNFRTSGNGNFYGVPGVKFIYHGAWADPELKYKGYSVDYYPIEDTLYDIFKEDHEEYNATMDEYVDIETGELVSFNDWVLKNKDLVYEILDNAIDSGAVYTTKSFESYGRKRISSHRVNEAYWENPDNPKKAFKAEIKFKLYEDDDTYIGDKVNGYYVLDDTYYIDSDYTVADVARYIVNDLLLVAGGGYSTDNIKDATVKINNRIVYKNNEFTSFVR